MVISAKQRITLWVPTILYVYLMLGEFGTDTLGSLVYRVNLRGAVSSILIISAAVLISHGSRGAFIAGVFCWILALAALFLERTHLMAIQL